MPSYVAVNTNYQNTQVVALGTGNGQVVVFSNTYDFVSFVQSQRTENIVLLNAMVRTRDINQLTKPIVFQKLEASGKISAKPHTPFVDNYALQSQVVLKGDDKMVFNGLNTIQYEINPLSEVTITFQVESKGSYTDMIVKDIKSNIMSLCALLDKPNNLREAQEQV